MPGVNKAIIVGNVGADPETLETASGRVTKIRIATSETWKDKAGEKQERTEWHRVSAWGKLGEIIASYVRKGSKVYVEGQIRTSSYEKNGEKRYSTEIVAREMQMLDSKRSSEPTQERETQEPFNPAEEDEIPF